MKYNLLLLFFSLTLFSADFRLKQGDWQTGTVISSTFAPDRIGFNLGGNKFANNNVFEFRNFTNFGIFSPVSNGTYLTYGIIDRLMINISADMAYYIIGKYENQTHLGENTTISVIYSNKKGTFYFAPYLETPFIGYYNEQHIENRDFNGFVNIPYVFGFNLVFVSNYETISVDYIFNFNVNKKIKYFHNENDEFEDDSGDFILGSLGCLSFGFLINSFASNNSIFKYGIILTTINFDGEFIPVEVLFQTALEKKINEQFKFTIGLAYEIVFQQLNLSLKIDYKF